MALKKTQIFWAGFVAILAIIAAAIIMRIQELALAGLTAFVTHLGIGLGTSLGHSVQRSAFYKPELDPSRQQTGKPEEGPQT